MDRLSAVDLSTMWPDETGWPQDIGLIGVVAWPHPWVDLVAAVRTAVERGLVGAPRLRQVVRTLPLGLGRPVWMDDPAFRLDDHVRVRLVPPPGGEAQLLAEAERIRQQPLDLRRPLWQLWLLPGLVDGRVGLYLRAHHAMADGEALIALTGALFSDAPDRLGADTAAWVPTPPPTTAELLSDNAQARACAAAGAVRAVVRGCARPARTVRDVRPGLTTALAALTDRSAPRTSLNRLVGPDRRTVLVRDSLADVLAAGHRHGATVNDVLLAAVAGGLGALLDGRGEATEGVALRAIVPVSRHRGAAGPAGGNRLGQMIVPLAVGRMPAATRLRLVRQATGPAKTQVQPRWAPALRSRRLRRGAMALAARQRSMNVSVTDVRGPGDPLTLAGAPLTEAFPVIALMANLPLGVGAISYAGQFNVSVLVDPDACPDLDRFVAGLVSTLQELTGRPGPHPSREAPGDAPTRRSDSGADGGADGGGDSGADRAADRGADASAALHSLGAIG